MINKIRDILNTQLGCLSATLEKELTNTRNQNKPLFGQQVAFNFLVQEEKTVCNSIKVQIRAYIKNKNNQTITFTEGKLFTEVELHKADKEGMLPALIMKLLYEISLNIISYES